MDKKKTAGIIGAIILALAGGSWALSFDFSSTTTSEINIGGDTTIEEGDTIIDLNATEIEEIIETAINLNCQLDIFEDEDCP